MLELVIFSTLNGVVYGLLLFMLSSGLTLIFSMMGVLNFAHASMFMLGAYFSYQVGKLVGFWPALVLAPLLVGLIGAGVERYGLRHVHRHGHVPELLFTFGLAYLIEEIVVMGWGRNPIENRVPATLDFPLFTLFTTSYPAYKAFMMAVSIGMFVALYLVLKRTRIGLIIQAALTHPSTVAMLGHNVPQVFMRVFAAGTALAALAGVIGGFALLTTPNMAAALGPIVFVVVVIGGLGSLGGALIASLAIGIMQTFAVALDVSLLDLLRHAGVAIGRESALFELASIKIAQAAPMIPYVLLVLMLIVRPKGLLGTRET
ncbi:MAG: ABC transporter permease [Candidatus Rokubacteria bacterium GWC2_70_24]|nr:MAG: ABC transporter permease [Candidatus Rokubacteria bacterium GWA2_70_23]OGK86899.1 MAG: ABC transporter permease [Candidatus Rokubacteria bacterium GWC2_70_24]OGK91518.1 MAG: ABC transporter permease [Candidatus Rokubacteria bacterium GWF2_70_14]HAM56430.1 branched-chain amino acid ABC transporter permease [Candidatus Rokubacteria bacterium]